MACLLSLGLLCQLAPSAEAYNPAQRAAQRPRHGDSSWIPAYVSVASDYTISSGIRTNTFTFKFKYEQAPERYENDGSEQALEIDVKIPCESDIYGQWASWDNGEGVLPSMDYPTNGSGWSTNIPNLAHPYEDTMFLDDCGDDDNHEVSVGFGVGDMSQLSVGTEYYVTFKTKGDSVGTAGYEPEIKLLVQTGTNYDADDPSAPFGSTVPLEKTCSYNGTANSEWNDATSTGFAHRKKASWCSWFDYQHRVVEPGSANPVYVGHGGTEYKRYTNLLNQDTGQSNDGRMERTDQTPDNSNWVKKEWLNEGTLSTVCDSTAYEGSCFLRLDGDPIAPAGQIPAIWASHINQAMTQAVGDQLSGNVELRCPDNADGNCKIYLEIWGFNSANPGDGTAEMKHIIETLPDDGQWYHCRVDNGGYENGVDTGASHQAASSTHGDHGFGWANAHNAVEFNVGAQVVDGIGHVRLDIDHATLGGKSEELDANGGYPFSPSGVNEVSHTNSCSLGTF